MKNSATCATTTTIQMFVYLCVIEREKEKTVSADARLFTNWCSIRNDNSISLLFSRCSLQTAARSLISRRHPHLTRRQTHHSTTLWRRAWSSTLNASTCFCPATLVHFLIAIVLFLFFFSSAANARWRRFSSRELLPLHWVNIRGALHKWKCCETCG